MSEKESAKPIAYRFKNNRGNGRFEYDYYDADEVSSAYRDNCIEITPLYTAPQSAELDALRSQVAALREALQALSGLYTHAWDRVEGGLVMLSGSVKKYDRAHGVAFAALTDTDAAAKEYERELRNRVLEEQLELLNKEYDAHDNARDFYMAARENLIRAMTETP